MCVHFCCAGDAAGSAADAGRREEAGSCTCAERSSCTSPATAVGGTRVPCAVTCLEVGAVGVYVEKDGKVDGEQQLGSISCQQRPSGIHRWFRPLPQLWAPAGRTLEIRLHMRT